MNLTDYIFKIKMIYNNTGSCEGLQNEWGLSAWIEGPNGVTLFDSGGNAETLQKNIEALKLDPSLINDVIISHKHWDHKGGLEYILKNIPAHTKIYVPLSAEHEFEVEYPETRIIGVDKAVNITKGLWSTGSLKTTYKGADISEQALILSNENKMMLLTGCSHPGIVKMVEQCLKIYPEKSLELVTGGFHLMRETDELAKEVSAQLKALGIKNLAPSHCTGDAAIEIFRKDWGENFVDFHLGDTTGI